LISVQTPSKPAHTVDALLRVIEVREAEVVLLKLMIDKLKLQLLRRVRAVRTLQRTAREPSDRPDRRRTTV